MTHGGQPAPRVAAADSIVIGLLAWLVPGAGHLRLGLRSFALVYFLAITIPFLVGMALGGVKSSTDFRENFWLFLAELGVGSYTLVFFGIAQLLGPIPAERLPDYLCFTPGLEVAQIYLAIAGMMNVLAVLDALSRAQTGGTPVLHQEVVKEAPQ